MFKNNVKLCQYLAINIRWAVFFNIDFNLGEWTNTMRVVFQK